MPKFFRGVVPAWLSRHRSSTPLPARHSSRDAVVSAAVTAVEALEARKLFAVTTLTNGTGDATLSITVDAYGAYGGAAAPAGDAFYDPVGIGGSAATTFESGVWFSLIDNFLAQGDLSGTGNLPNVNFTSTTANTAISSFTQGGFAFQLTQTVNPVDNQGTTLTQTYRATNNTGTPQTIRFVRHVDGDMAFQPGIADFAGVSADSQFVFEFDTATDPTQASGFFGISAANQGGTNSGFAIAPYAPGGFFDDIDNANGIPGANLNNLIGPGVAQNADVDANRLTDAGYDVTISFQTDFASIAPGTTIVYTTITRFGQGPPSDIIGTPRVQFSATNYQRAENGRFATITVTREGSTLGNATVDVDVLPGGTATDGVDFTDPTNPGVLTLTFAPGQARVTFQIPIIDDDILDGDETVLLQLSNPSAGTDLGIPVDATLTILDDTPFIQLVSSTFEFDENVGLGRITAIRTGSTIGEATVNYAVVANGTATAGADFTVVTGQLLFANGQREAYIDVPIIQDFVLEGDETFGVVLSNATGAGLGSPSIGAVTITNFETPPTISDVDTIGFSNRITQIVLTFTADLDPARATLHTNYQLYIRNEKKLGGAGSRQQIRIDDAKFEYDAAADTVTITPVKQLKLNRFYEINVAGNFPTAVAAIGGTLLDGDADGEPGGDYRNYFGRGNRLWWYDREGDFVELRTEAGGVLDIDRPVARRDAQVEMYDVFPFETILTGSFSRARTGFSDDRAEITLLNSFGVSVQLPPQIVVTTPDLV